MGPYLIAGVTLAYLGVAMSFWPTNKNMTIVFAGYAASNIGFLLEAMKP